MKRMLFAVIFIPLFCTFASAEWQADFDETYVDKGIEEAVKVALEDGVDPNSITGQARNLAGLNLQDLVKALYCSGVKGQDIRDAAANNEISESTVIAGYKISLAECHDAVVRSQGYTPVTERFAGSGRTRSGGGRKTFASPSTF